MNPDTEREMQVSEEWFEEWREARLAALDAKYAPPWTDAGPETSSEEKER